MTGQSDGPPVVGIDLGGTKILAGVVSGDHRILGRAKRTTPAKEGGPAILAAVVGCVDEALAAAGLSTRDQIAAAGIGSPGPLDVAAGTILFSANLNVKNYPIGPELAVGAGPARSGAKRRARRRLRRTPAGSGPRLSRRDRRVRRHRDRRLPDPGGRDLAGATGNAGEIGHMVVKAGGPRCGCGARDAWKPWPARPPSPDASKRPSARVCQPCSAKR